MPPKLAQAPDVEVAPVGQSTGNVGITRFQVRRSLLDPIGYEILVEVVNCSDEPVECRLELDLNGDVVDVVPLKLEPDGRWAQVFEKTSADGGRLRRPNQPARRAGGRQRGLRDPAQARVQPVTLVTDGNLFLEKVFEAIPLVRLSVTKELPQGPVRGGRFTVFHRKVPDALPAGPVLVIDPAIRATSGRSATAAQSDRHQARQGFAADGARAARQRA